MILLLCLVVLGYMLTGLVLSSALVHRCVIVYEVDILFSTLLWPLVLIGIWWTYFTKMIVYLVYEISERLFSKKDRK